MTKAQRYKFIIKHLMLNILRIFKEFVITIPLGIVSAVITILVIKTYQKRTGNLVKKQRRTAIALFVAYTTVVVQMAILFRPWGTIHVIDWIPFDTPGGFRYIVLYSVANMIMFLPLGILLPIGWKKMSSLKRVLIAGFCGSLFIEVSQLLLQCGVFQTEDLIMNTVGAGLGYGMYRSMERFGMSKDLMNDIRYKFMYLVSCALNNTVPEMEYLSSMELDALYKMSKAHSMSAIVFAAIELINKSGKLNADDSKVRLILDDWEKEKEKSVYKTILMDLERENLIQYMEQKKIWYMPLKGIIIKEMYPETAVRQMADNDILFDEKYREQMKKHMVAEGFKVREYDIGNHDVYIKLPAYNFEMHVGMVSKRSNPAWVKYYRDIKDRLCIKDENNGYGYHLSDEDFYVYMVIHAFKHYDEGGTGLRTLADFYIFNREKENSMDWEYLHRELAELEVSEFEKEMRFLAEKVFSKSECLKQDSFTEQERKILGVILSSGTYGTQEREVKKRIQDFQEDGQEVRKTTKIKYTFRRVFPEIKYIKEFYPIARKHKWAIPFVYIYRIYRGLFSQRKKIRGEFKAAWKK